jgi:5-methylcytosine-specific restriction endonuclease McrA
MPKLPRFPVTEWGTKVCTACFIEKPVTEYWAKRESRNGVAPRCKECRYAQTLAYRRANAEKYRVYYQAKYQSDPEIRAKSAARQKAHPERNRQSTARYRAANAELVRARRIPAERARYAANPEPLREARRRWRREQPERYKAVQKRYYLSNRDAIQAANHRRRVQIRTSGSYTAADWQAIKTTQQYRCLMCGRVEPDIRLTVDHIVPVSAGGSNEASNIQGLCKPCNSRKGRNTLDLRAVAQEVS